MKCICYRIASNNDNNSNSHVTTCLGHLGWHNKDRIISISCHAVQGGQGATSLMVSHTILPIYTNL